MLQEPLEISRWNFFLASKVTCMPIAGCAVVKVVCLAGASVTSLVISVAVVVGIDKV